MAKKTWIPPRFKNQLHCGIVAGGRGVESSVAARAGSHYGGPQLSRQNQKPHGKNKIPYGKTENLTAKTKTSQQKQNTSRQNQNSHGKTKDLTTKPNTSQQKPNTSRQKQIPTAKPTLFCFCREVFCFTVRYFVIAVTVGGHHKFAIASNVRIYYVNVFRRVGGGGGGGSRGSDEPPLGRKYWGSEKP